MVTAVGAEVNDGIQASRRGAQVGSGATRISLAARGGSRANGKEYGAGVNASVRRLANQSRVHGCWAHGDGLRAGYIASNRKQNVPAPVSPRRAKCETADGLHKLPITQSGGVAASYRNKKSHSNQEK